MVDQPEPAEPTSKLDVVEELIALRLRKDELVTELETVGARIAALEARSRRWGTPSG